MGSLYLKPLEILLWIISWDEKVLKPSKIASSNGCPRDLTISISLIFPSSPTLNSTINIPDNA